MTWTAKATAKAAPAATWIDPAEIADRRLVKAEGILLHQSFQ